MMTTPSVQEIHAAIRNDILAPNGNTRAARQAREDARRALFAVFMATMPEEQRAKLLQWGREKCEQYGGQFGMVETAEEVIGTFGTSSLIAAGVA